MPIKVILEDDKEIAVQPGTKLIDIVKLAGLADDRNIVAALVDNKMRELSATLDKDAAVRFVGLNTLDGIRVYQRSASFILIKALHDLCPEAKIRILHPIANGLYCEIKGAPEMSTGFAKALENKMQEIVVSDIPFCREEVPIDKAIAYFKGCGKDDKARLLSFRDVSTASIYQLDDQKNYFYGYLAPATGYIKHFSLTPYDDGIILHLPSIANPNKLVPAKKSRKLYDVFKETRRWRHILEVEDVGMLNEVIKTKRYTEFSSRKRSMKRKSRRSPIPSLTAERLRSCLFRGPVLPEKPPSPNGLPSSSGSTASNRLWSRWMITSWIAKKRRDFRAESMTLNRPRRSTSIFSSRI
jgi:uridine kinase